MPKFKARVFVFLRKNVKNKEAEQVKKTLNNIGYTVSDFNLGKFMDVIVEAYDELSAKCAFEKMTKEFLANTVMEDYEIEMLGSNEQETFNKEIKERSNQQRMKLRDVPKDEFDGIIENGQYDND
jgi:phosphoribosylformylglycinamidine synthase